MNSIFVALVLISHAFAARIFVNGLRGGHFPSAAGFAGVSVIVYYDIGIVLELLGFPYEAKYFTSLLAAPWGTFIFAMCVLALTPWLFMGGAAIVDRTRWQASLNEQLSSLRADRRRSFYSLAVAIGLGLAIYSLARIGHGAPLWDIRTQVGASFGPFVLILYFPLFILAFFVRQRDARGGLGTILTVLFVAAACTAALVLSERTLVLIPLVIVLMFRVHLTTARLLAIAVATVLCAALLLPIFKWQYAGGHESPIQLIAGTLNDDVARAGVFRKALEMSLPVGTRIMPYPMAGYTYAVLFPVPRGVAPFKGTSTAQYFTGTIVGTPPLQTSWGFGVGAIEEIILNVGTLAVIPGLLIYGMLFGWLDTASRRFPVLVGPTRLAAIFVCGYNVTALLLLFGGMAAVGLLLQRVFATSDASVPTSGLGVDESGIAPENMTSVSRQQL
jgi:hypothetical protein